MSAHILLVDDEPSIRALAARILEGAGYTVTAAAGPAEALDALEQAGGAFDLLLTDMVMPGMTGGALTTAIAERYPELPVVTMSGYAGDAPGGAPNTVRARVQKPFTSQDLLAAIAAALAPLPSPRGRGADTDA